MNDESNAISCAYIPSAKRILGSFLGISWPFPLDAGRRLDQACGYVYQDGLGSESTTQSFSVSDLHSEVSYKWNCYQTEGSM